MLVHLSSHDLADKINDFIKDIQVIDIKFSTCAFQFQDEQIYCFSALIMYVEKRTG